MTPQEIIDFKDQFEIIVGFNSQITKQNEKIKQLSRWDKDGSHKKAIIYCQKERDSIRYKLQPLLKGKSYDEWKLFSKRLSMLNSQMTATFNKQNKLIKEIHNLTF